MFQSPDEYGRSWLIKCYPGSSRRPRRSRCEQGQLCAAKIIMLTGAAKSRAIVEPALRQEGRGVAGLAQRKVARPPFARALAFAFFLIGHRSIGVIGHGAANLMKFIAPAPARYDRGDLACGEGALARPAKR